MMTELLVVMVILGILFGMAIIMFNPARSAITAQHMVSQAQIFKNAIEEFKSDNAGRSPWVGIPTVPALTEWWPLARGPRSIADDRSYFDSHNRRYSITSDTDVPESVVDNTIVIAADPTTTYLNRTGGIATGPILAPAATLPATTKGVIVYRRSADANGRGAQYSLRIYRRKRGSSAFTAVCFLGDGSDLTSLGWREC